MNIPLEIKKKKAEMLRVLAAKAEQEFKIEEFLDQIERLKNAIVTQEEKLVELEKEVERLESLK